MNTAQELEPASPPFLSLHVCIRDLTQAKDVSTTVVSVCLGESRVEAY